MRQLPKERDSGPQYRPKTATELYCEKAQNVADTLGIVLDNLAKISSRAKSDDAALLQVHTVAVQLMMNVLGECANATAAREAEEEKKKEAAVAKAHAAKIQEAAAKAKAASSAPQGDAKPASESTKSEPSAPDWSRWPRKEG